MRWDTWTACVLPMHRFIGVSSGTAPAMMHRMTRTITHGDLRDGMQVYVCGYLFTVQNVRHYVPSFEPQGDRRVTRYEGTTTDPRLTSTSYSGGTYGAWSDLPCVIRVDDPTADDAPQTD